MLKPETLFMLTLCSRPGVPACVVYIAVEPMFKYSRSASSAYCKPLVCILSASAGNRENQDSV
jgi:hypothetical protein